MLTPDYLQGAPEEIEGLFQRLEREIISDICRRIAKAASLTDTAQHEIIRMKELGAGTDYIKKKIKEVSGLSEQAVDRLFFDAAQTSSDFYADVYARANVPYVPYEYNDFFQQLTTSMINQTRGELVNITQSIGFSYMGANGIRKFYPAAKAYHDTLDYAVTQVSSGMTDYITAIRNATRRLTDSGLQYVDYESGVRTRADVAARRAVLTGLSQMTGRVAEHNMRELDTDIVEVSAHAGARPDHAEWQGRWYSFSGKSKDYPSLVEVTGYGTGAGLKGWNCRHDFYPVIPGISEPTYTEEELRNIDPPPFEYRGRKYDAYAATQKQRAMERGIRQTKRELLAAESVGDKDMFDAKSVLLRRQREEYTKFSDKAGLLPQNERTQVNGFGRSQGSKAAWAAKKAQSAKKGGGSSGGSGSSGSSGQAVTVAVPGGSNGGSGKVYRDQGLTSGGGSGMISEEERARHSQKYAVSQNLTESSRFTRKFNSMTDDAELRRQFYQESKATLHNRSGTNGEDLKYYNPRLKKWYRSTKGKEAGTPDYNNEILQGLSDAEPFELISFHNHPNGMPPSDKDINCALQNKYKVGYTIGHNGKIFEYTAPKYYIDENVYLSRVSSYIGKGYSEFEAQLYALKDLQGIYQFEFREVK